MQTNGDSAHDRVRYLGGGQQVMALHGSPPKRFVFREGLRRNEDGFVDYARVVARHLAEMKDAPRASSTSIIADRPAE